MWYYTNILLAVDELLPHHELHQEVDSMTDPETVKAPSVDSMEPQSIEILLMIRSPEIKGFYN